jgi:hypothetical protein
MIRSKKSNDRKKSSILITIFFLTSLTAFMTTNHQSSDVLLQFGKCNEIAGGLMDGAGICPNQVDVRNASDPWSLPSWVSWILPLYMATDRFHDTIAPFIIAGVVGIVVFVCIWKRE